MPKTSTKKKNIRLLEGLIKEWEEELEWKDWEDDDYDLVEDELEDLQLLLEKGTRRY
jgi:hypothetical protein